MTAPVSTSVPASASAEDSPSQRHPEWYRYSTDRTRCVDLFAGTSAIHEKIADYLPKHEKEDPKDHVKRGEFTEVYNGFGRTITAMAGLVFQKPPKLGDDIDPDIRAHYERLDVRGVHGDVFLRDAFVDGLVTGFGGFLVEYPEVAENAAGRRLTLADERARGLRPYWSYVGADDLYVFRTAEVAGEEYLTLLVLGETRLREHGTFGVASVRVYRVYRHDLDQQRITVEEWEERTSVGGTRSVEISKEATPVLGVKRIPFAPFQMGKPCGRFVAKPPLLDLAEVNLAHYRVSADRRWLMHLCCVPVPWARGLQPNPDGTTTLQIGPNVALLLTENGAFGWAEPTGSAFGPTGDEMRSLENRMAALGLSFIQRDTRAAETAEARRIDSAAQNSTLSDAARRFEDAVEMAFGFHAEFLKKSSPRSKSGDSSGSFSLNREFETTVLADSTLALLMAAQRDGQLALETLWELMERGKILAEGFDKSRELARIQLERQDNEPDEPDEPDVTDDTAREDL